MRRSIVSLLLLLLAVPAFAAKAKEPSARDRAFDEAREEFYELRKDPKRRALRHHWLNAGRPLDKLARDPKAPHGCEAQFLAGRLYAELSRFSKLADDRAAALERLDRVEQLCSSSPLADDALLAAAEVAGRTDPAAARARLVTLQRRHPKGDMGPAAKKALAALGVAPEPKPEAAPKVARAEPEPKLAKVARKPEKVEVVVAEARKDPAPKPAPKPKVAPGAPVRREADAGKPGLPVPPPRAVASLDAEAEEVDPAELPAIAVLEAADRALAGSAVTAERVLGALDGRNADAARPSELAHARDLELAAAPLDKDRLAELKKQLKASGELSLSMIAGLKVRRVVIDAGHGGYDVGAVGKAGTRESNVTLAIAQELGRELTAMGLEVVLTRDTDRYLALEERTRIANEQRADLFISIHCNAARSRKLRGVETYTLNLSSDKYAQKLAARENAGTSRTVSDLQFILADLATKANTDDSRRLARSVQRELVSGLQKGYGGGIRDLGNKEALFFVLMGAKMPAILVETSFLSHPEEEKLLASAAYQKAVAQHIAAGVRDFLGEREAIARGPGSVF